MRALTLAAIWLAETGLAQSEAALKAFFEGKTVQARIDLPGTHDGLDVYYKQDPPYDQRTLQRRLAEWGAAVPAGTDITVSLIRVKGRNIEFQLGGGGLNESPSVNLSTYVPKSRYEEDLERDIRRETDSRRKDSMNRELNRLRDSRRREERRLQLEKERLEALKRAELRTKALRYGSRINLWFPNHYLKESVPTPEELMRMLADYIDFQPGAAVRPGVSRFPGAVIPNTSHAAPLRRTSSTGLRRGMVASEVHRLLGAPLRSKDSKEGSIQVRTEAWEYDDESIEVDFAEGIVLRWRVLSK